MGCQCLRKVNLEDEEIRKESEPNNKPIEMTANNNSIPNKEKFLSPSMSQTSIFSSAYTLQPKKDYNKEVFNLINVVRTNPSGYVSQIEESIQNIKLYNDQLIYEGFKVKVSLTEGEVVFREAAKLLSTLYPLSPLEWSDRLSIDVPENEDDMKNPLILKELANKRKTTVPICSTLKDSVKDPYTAVLLMIVDDSGVNAGKKRNIILNPSIKSIAITSRVIRKTFCAYLTFSKE